MPPDDVSAPQQVVFSRELYTLIVSVSSVPVLLFLIWLSWVIINRLMSPEWRQRRRGQEIRKAVAAREARLAAAREKAGEEKGQD